MNWQVIKIKVLRRLKKFVLYTLYFGLVLFVMAFAVLQIPAVQKNLLGRLTQRFSEASGFDIKFDSFYLLWYDRLEITGLRITDPQKNLMIEAGRLFVNFELSTVYSNKDIYLDALILQEGGVNLVTIPDTDSTTQLNIDVFIAALSGTGSSGGGGRSPKVFIGEVLVQQSEFSMNKTGKDSLRGFDYNHFRLALDEGNLDNFKVIGDTIEFQLGSLQVMDQKTKLTIKEFSTFFRISQSSMEFVGMQLNCNKSFISDTVIFKYNSQRDLNDFNELVSIHAHLKNTKIYPEDLSFFTMGLENWKDPLLISGTFQGKVSHFNFKPMEIVVGSSRVTGSLEMDGLPSINETFINARLNPSTVSAQDIGFLFPDYVTSKLTPLYKLQLRGNFLGFINDFVANGDFVTRFGEIRSDINYKIDEKNVNLSSYKGKLVLTNFELGKFLNDTTNFQTVNLSGSINGRGLTKQTADFVLTGNVPSIGIRGYNYVNIHSNARFANQFFKGELAINDPNLQLAMSGSIDLRDGADLIDVQATLDTAILHKLKITNREVFLKTYLDIDSRGLELDSVTGSALFQKTLLQYKDETIKFDSIHLISENLENGRSLTLRSSMADLTLSGNFYYSTLFHDIEKLVREFVLNLENDPIAIQNYYLTKPKAEHTYKAAIHADVHNVNPIFQMLDLDLYVSPETLVEGEFTNSVTSSLHVKTHLDTVIYGGKTFSKNEIEFNGSKVRDSTQVLAQLTVTSDHQVVNPSFHTKNLFLEGIWNLDHIDLDFDFDQDGYDNSVRLKTEIDFLDDSTRIRVLPSVIRLLGEDWLVNTQNYSLVKGPEWSIHHLGLSKGQQQINVSGFVSHDPSRVLRVDIRDFDLSALNFFSTEEFKGRVNAQFMQRDLYSEAFVENILTIDSLKINNFLVGEVHGNNTRDPVSDQFNINFTVDRLGHRIVDVKGYYDPNNQESPLQTRATLEKANLKLLEPVIKDIFSNLGGTLTGAYDIRGTFSKPEFSGEATIDGGQITVNYLKTPYLLQGTLGMTPSQIQFRDFELNDQYSNKGKLNGYIAHRNFSQMRVNIDASFVNFHLLNTVQKDNSLFYGQAFGTGSLNVLGPVSNLRISATARTNKNTRISLPMNSTISSQEKKEFIQFTSFTDTVKTKLAAAQSTKRELKGIILDLNIEVTPDAYTEIIFDIKSGDIIRGRGRGDLRLQVDTKGEFNMFGPIEFSEGAYNFTLYDIINKEFSIRPGSSIRWYGDPYEGILNITASYRQLTSMAPVLTDQTDQTILSDPNVRRKYPVEVLLKLDGPMLSPQLTFDLEAKDLPDNVITADGKSVRLKFDFNAFKASLDENELKFQVFSLIILRKLTPRNTFATSSTTTLVNSVSELFSNQLSYWLSQVDQNLEIDLDLGTLDQEAFNTFQLRLSYKFLGGRLRVSKDGNFGGSQATRSELSTIAGDWTVDYLLTPDGKFKVKMYSRSSVNQLQSSINTQTAAVTTGASLLYTQNFNEFKDLLRSARDRRRKELEKELAEETDGKGN